jgi:zinc protease
MRLHRARTAYPTHVQKRDLPRTRDDQQHSADFSRVRGFAGASLAALVALLAAVTLVAQAPDRAQAPRLGAPPTLHLPAIQKRQLANGVPVWMVELHEVPVVQVNLVILSGAAADPAGKFGVTSLMTAMLEEGAGSRSSLEISDAIDFLGADLAAGSSFDSSAVRLHVPLARLADALAIMADVALRPTFPKEELERVRQQRLTALLQARDDPATIAAQALPRVLYGATHRYGSGLAGSAQTIGAITVEDLRMQYASLVRPANSALVVVGDIVPERVMPLLETHFGAWRSTASAAAVALPPAAPPAKREISIVDKPAAPQTQIRIGSIGVARSTPDYFPIQVMNTILGGSFTSRLNMNLREKHGYAYGATSAFDMRASPGPVAAAAGVQTDKTSEALKEFFVELTAIRQLVPADELSRAKNYISLRFPSGFESTTDISRRLEDAVVFHLPDDYFSTYVANIEAVTAAEVQRVATKYIQPERVAVVVVGDRKVIEPGIQALNLGTIKPLAIDDVFGPAPALAK